VDKVLRPLAEDALQQARSRWRDVASIAIHGEIFGGHWPGSGDGEGPGKLPDGAAPVPWEVLYCDRLSFTAFDLLLTFHSETCLFRYGRQTSRLFADFDAAKELLETSGFTFTQPLFRGSFEDCVSYPTEFPSTIPGLLRQWFLFSPWVPHSPRTHLRASQIDRKFPHTGSRCPPLTLRNARVSSRKPPKLCRRSGCTIL